MCNRKENQMSAYVWELDEDLEAAVLQGALTQQEAWHLMDDRLLHPRLDYPREMIPLLRKLCLVEYDPQGMTCQ
jgi:hypothetical protein